MTGTPNIPRGARRRAARAEPDVPSHPRDRRPRLRPAPAQTAPRHTWTREHLLAVAQSVEAGHLTPVIDLTYLLADPAAGLRYLKCGQARGKGVISVA
jgi:NADPH:quinone reductase-like Zn-dependent oxidoreductase